MTKAVTYDMQKLGEAVSILALGSGPLKERLKETIIPLGTLHMGGLHNRKRADEFDGIYERLTGNRSIQSLSDDEARELARDIVDLNSGIWYDAVWELEDQLRERS